MPGGSGEKTEKATPKKRRDERKKGKLLRYSIPRTEEEQDTKVDIRFYPNEASEIIYMLIYNVDDLDISTNYFEVLQKVREAKKQEMNNE